MPTIINYLKPYRSIATAAALRFSPEIDLLVLCARTALQDDDIVRLRGLAGHVTDWRYLVDLAQAHGVMPLLYRHITHVSDFIPPSILAALTEAFTNNARKNVLLTAEMLRVLHLFQSAPVPVLMLKGSVLAQMVYGDLALRQFIDLDLLIQQADYAAADALLRAQGYLPTYRFSPSQRAWHLRRHYELEYTHPATNISVDLHWALLPKNFSFSPDSAFVWQNQGQAYFGTTPVPTLSPEATLLFISAHSAKHNWCSLGFLADIAEVLRSQPDLDWAWITAHADSLGNRRMLDLSLSLASYLLDAPLPPHVARRLADDPRLAALSFQALHLLFRENTDSILTQFVTGNLYVRSMSALADKVRYWVSEIVTPTPLEWALVRLPASLFVLYYPLRLARICYKLVEQVFTKMIHIRASD